MGDAWDSTQVASVDLVTAQKWNDMVIDQKSRGDEVMAWFGL